MTDSPQASDPDMPDTSDRLFVHLARSDLGTNRTAFLNPREQQRLLNLRQPDDRQRYITARALLKSLVSNLTGKAPRHIDIQQRCPDCGGYHGQPTLPNTGLSLSISHSGDWVVVAAARGCRIGVDIDQLGRLDKPERMVNYILHADEKQRLRAQQAKLNSEILIRHWVPKEACLKAVGTGLRIPPSSICLDTDSHSARWHKPDTQNLPSEHCSIRDIAVHRDYHCCVATVGTFPGQFDIEFIDHLNAN